MNGAVVLLVLLVVAVPALVWGSGLGTFSMARLALFFGPLALVLPYVLSRRRPTWFLMGLALVLLPVAGIVIPPARLGLQVFHAIGLLLLLFSLGARGDERPARILPPELRWMWMPLLLLLPGVLLAGQVGRAALEWLCLWSFYAYALVGAVYLAEPRNMETAHAALGTSLLAVSVAVVLHKLSGVSFGFLYEERGMVSASGMLVKQGSGLFQDPQKAGQFIAMLATYLAVVWQRDALPRRWTRLIVVVALVVSVPALILTLSRLAVAAGLVFGGLALFFLGRSRIHAMTLVRLALGGVLLMAVIILGSEAIVGLLPFELQRRFADVDASAFGRLQVWQATFFMFAQNPIVGVGLGNFQAYLAEAVGSQLMNGVPVPDQPESGYLKILYETGLIGFIALLWFIIGAMRAVAINLRSAGAGSRSRAVATLATVGVFGITFVTLFTVSDARNALLVVFLATVATADHWHRQRLRAPSGLDPEALQSVLARERLQRQ